MSEAQAQNTVENPEISGSQIDEATEFKPEVNTQSAADLAAELQRADAEQNLDFDPETEINLGATSQDEALGQVQGVLISDEGAAATVADGLNMVEHLVKEHCHPEFEISESSKKMGQSNLKPLIQKYAPAAIGLFGSYKDEIMGAFFLGSLVFSSVKQIKALKQRDAMLAKAGEPEQEETEQAEQTETAQGASGAAH